MKLKVLYLFTGYRGPHLVKVAKGEADGNGFWGMLRLPTFGVDANHLELEQFFPLWLARFVRRHLSVYWVHLPLYPKFFSYDIVFTSTGFGTQLVHTLLRRKKPLWVMHDFSVSGLIGEEKTLKQKLFRYIVARCAGIVTVGEEETQKLKKRFPHLADRIEYIPFGVDIELFKPVPFVEEKNQVIAVGFDPDRDWKTYFEAGVGLHVPFIAATRQSRVEKLQPLPEFAVVKSFGLHEMIEEYARSAVVVIPLDTSRGTNDAMGASTLFEAMAMGKAIVATDTHTMRSYIRDGVNGVLVPEGDSAALHNAISSLLVDESKRKELGANARAYAEEYLDADKVTEKLATFFKRIAI